MSLVIDLIDLVAKHKAGELRCPATALIMHFFLHQNGKIPDFKTSVPTLQEFWHMSRQFS